MLKKLKGEKKKKKDPQKKNRSKLWRETQGQSRQGILRATAKLEKNTQVYLEFACLPLKLFILF